MHLYLTFLLGVIQFHASPTTAGLIRHVINGIDSQPDQWPFMAALHRITEDKQSKRNYKFFCGAVIWDNQTILTAAHCLEGEEADQIAVYIGHVNRTAINADYIYDGKEIITHAEFVHFEAYNAFIVLNDIGLLKLAKPINFTVSHPRISPVPRSESQQQLVNPKRCITLGWGYTELDDVSMLLREADISLENCYPQCPIQEWGHIKAGDTGAQTGSCIGDSGGPLLCALTDEPQSYSVIGITSHGNGHCLFGIIDELPIYTYVPHYLNWIKRNVGE